MPFKKQRGSTVCCNATARQLYPQEITGTHFYRRLVGPIAEIWSYGKSRPRYTIPAAGNQNDLL